MIRLIAALDRKRGIAKQGIEPWFIPQDAAYFAQKTKSQGSEILTGSTTYKTLKGPLPDRTNYVLTHDKTPLDGVTLVHDLESFLEPYYGDGKDLWVIGGANLYGQVIDAHKADELYLTHVDADFGCTQFFPEYEAAFSRVEQSDLHEQNGFIFAYAKYVPNA